VYDQSPARGGARGKPPRRPARAPGARDADRLSCTSGDRDERPGIEWLGPPVRLLCLVLKADIPKGYARRAPARPSSTTNVARVSASALGRVPLRIVLRSARSRGLVISLCT